jgi:hypothetical protein
VIKDVFDEFDVDKVSSQAFNLPLKQHNACLTE